MQVNNRSSQVDAVSVLMPFALQGLTGPQLQPQLQPHCSLTREPRTERRLTQNDKTCVAASTDLRVFIVDWKPELTYGSFCAKTQLNFSKREASNCTM